MGVLKLWNRKFDPPQLPTFAVWQLSYAECDPRRDKLEFLHA